jgi:hypothetical protein
MIKTSEIKKWYFLCPFIFAVSALIIISRRPDSYFNPQFWAEDGAVWYADAYNHGVIYSLVTPEAGYFQLFSRLVGILSQVLPLAKAPLFFNLTAIGVQATVAWFITSSRLSSLIPNLRWRLFIAFIYLALPHSFEINANITNSQWHLGLLSFLIVAAEPSKKLIWRIFDFAVISVSVLSGPLCLLLTPIVALKFWRRREKRLLVILGILCFGGLVQTISLLTHARPTQADLGAEIGLFFNITFRHILVSPIIGQSGFHLITEYFDWNVVLVSVVLLVAVFLTFYALLTSVLELRLFILFSVLVYAAALFSPAVTPVNGQWEAIAAQYTATRYWFIPSLCVIASLLYLASKAKSVFVRYLSMVALIFLPYGIIRDWDNPKFENLNFPMHAAEFEKADPGSKVYIPINPTWKMKLVKKQ